MNNQFSHATNQGKFVQGLITYQGDMKNATLVALTPAESLVTAIPFYVILQNSDQLFNFIQSKTNKEALSAWNNYFMRKAKTNKSHPGITFNISVLLSDDAGVLADFFL